MAKKFNLKIRVNVPEKINEALEKELTDQLGVLFEKIKKDKPRTK